MPEEFEARRRKLAEDRERAQTEASSRPTILVCLNELREGVLVKQLEARKLCTLAPEMGRQFYEGQSDAFGVVMNMIDDLMRRHI